MTTPATEAAWAGIGLEAGRVPASLPVDRDRIAAFGILAGTVSLIVREVQEDGRLGQPVTLLEAGAGELVVVPPDRAGRILSVRATRGATWTRLDTEARAVMPHEAAGLGIRPLSEAPEALSDWNERQAPGTTWSEFLQRVGSVLEEQSTQRVVRAREEALDRLSRRRILDDESLHQSVVAMTRRSASESVDYSERSPSRSVQAILDVIEALGGPTGGQLGLHPPSSMTPVEFVGRALHLKHRSVKLEGSWWTDDAGPLFVEAADRGVPVALIPRRGGYLAREYHPDGVRTIEPLDRERAAGYGTEATMFYRPFSAGPTRVLELLRMLCARNVRDLVTVIIVTLLTSLMVTLVPILTGHMIGTAIPNMEHAQLVFIGAMLVSVAVSRALLHLVSGIAFLRIETRSSYQIVAALVDRVLQLPASFFRGTSAGDLTQRVMAVERIRSALTQSVLSVSISLVASLSNLGVLLFYDATLGLTALIVIAVELVLVILISIGMARADYRLTVAQGELDGFGMDMLVGVRQIKIQGAHGRAMSHLLDRLGRVAGASYRTGVLGIWLGVVLAAASTTALVLVFTEFTAGLRDPASSTVLDAGGFVAFITALSAFMGAVTGFAPAIRAVANMVPQVKRVKPILATSTEVADTTGELSTLRGGLSTRGLRFGYDPDLPPVLEGVDLDVGQGEFVAIVGGTGCGKSTLLNLLLGLEKPSSGQVLYDGIPLDSLDPVMVRSQVGVVMQSNQTISGNVQSLILGVGSTGTLDDAWAAARLVGMEEEIDGMPMGMLTMITPNAMSQSQLQRLLIARALVGAPKVLFLDEATSALDNTAQEAITRTIDELGSTRVVIAHRLSTIRRADRIYVLDRGRIVQSGTFDELAGQDGLFRTLMAGQVS
ncbi:MAG: ATP-binding cassette domain-containing protein [Planctomycetota bacterium]|nr:ATP-binding cassette domain-containing protein [Planctomycetota bacterium]